MTAIISAFVSVQLTTLIAGAPSAPHIENTTSVLFSLLRNETTERISLIIPFDDGKRKKEEDEESWVRLIDGYSPESGLEMLESRVSVSLPPFYIRVSFPFSPCLRGWGGGGEAFSAIFQQRVPASTYIRERVVASA